MTKKLGAWCGILAPVIFIFAIIVFSLLTPNYSNLTDAISELGMLGSPYSLACNIVGFIIVGILIVIFAWGLHVGIRPEPGAIIAPLLVCISGIGVIGWGIFPAESDFRPSTQTTLHFVMVAINYLPFILVAFLYAIRLKDVPYWKSWKLFSIAMGVLAIASFFIPRTIPPGLSQRIGLGAYFMWLFVIGYALLQKPARS